MTAMTYMTEADRLERLAETLNDAVAEMEPGKYCAAALGERIHEEWYTVFTRLRNLRSVVVDRRDTTRRRETSRARFDTQGYATAHGKEPAGRGTWILLPLGPGGTPLLAEEVEYCGDIDTLMDGDGPFRLPDFPRFMICP